jgi:lysophospholipid acyltransferase (LPLAT)-like uncharacterized protein
LHALTHWQRHAVIYFKNVKYRQILPLFSGKLIPAFFRYVRRCWHKSEWEVHPDTQVLLNAGKPVIYTLWHGQMFALLHPEWMNHTPPTVLISQSRDGDFIANCARHIGFHNVIRGAQGRGGTDAARRIRQLLVENRGTLMCLADGPRGPRHKAKLGIVSLAQQLGIPIVPVAAVAPAHWFKFESAWDAFEIPTPYRPIITRLGAPLILPADVKKSDAVHSVNTAMDTHLCETLARYSQNPKNR